MTAPARILCAHADDGAPMHYLEPGETCEQSTAPAVLHPAYCAMSHGENNSHFGPYVLAGNIGVVVVERPAGPLVRVGRDEWRPGDARKIAGLLSLAGACVLAAAVSHAADMAEA